ncbi:hypothetical protein EIP91_004556 [Steccherinum ochraceum]|uniref:Uncharacterized protein n=1 Tax=Steccherinum ochraceum TaxID=92696 RepID=A0A4R0RNZ7_9APHY|nr:hypothetical protein EIP91_004556 [Steccherinum ochraceum]
MSHTYGSWSSSNPKDDQRQYVSGVPSSGSRRSGNSEQQAFGYTDSYMQTDQYSRGGTRRSAAGTTSSLSGAMGDLHMSSSSSNSPPSNASSPSGLAWTPSSPSSTMPEGYLANEAGSFNYLGTPPTSGTSYSYHAPGYAGGSPESPHQIPSGVASSAYPDTALIYSQGRQSAVPMTAQGAVPMTVSPTPTSSPLPISRSSRSHPDAEIHHFRNKIRELELINKSARERIRVLEHEVARVNYTGTSSTAIGGLPSPLPTPTLHTSQGFEENWQLRTDARVKLFCSLNRAGNALCAWHDSRRERRQFPPRNAPPGYLNCGCSYEEALFEESLARHGVGSYHPGESVRMDPALRNPLLKLLQDRYGYRDGDFERSAATGNWKQGEGAAYWEARAASGYVKRQNRSDSS